MIRIILGIVFLIFSGSAYAKENTVLKVGATPVPAAEILEFIKPILKKEGIDLVIQNFTDYITPNIALNDGSSDANLYQHKPFLDRMNKDRGLNLVPLSPVYVVPLSLYSKKHKSADTIAKGATIALPNDPTNYSRSLILLHDNGLIKLKDPTNLDATEFDIVENPRSIKFKTVEAAMLPKVLDGVDAAIVNANYALQSGMKISDSLFHENDKSMYTNVFATRKGNENDLRILKLQEVLTGKEVREFILKKYGGEIIPVSRK